MPHLQGNVIQEELDLKLVAITIRPSTTFLSLTADGFALGLSYPFPVGGLSRGNGTMTPVRPSW